MLMYNRFIISHDKYIFENSLLIINTLISVDIIYINKGFLSSSISRPIHWALFYFLGYCLSSHVVYELPEKKYFILHSSLYM